MLRTRGSRACVGVAAAVVSVALTACTSSSGTDPSRSDSPAASVITTSWPTDLVTLDPGNNQTDQDREIDQNVYQTLVDYSFKAQDDGAQVSQGLDAAPGIASSWKLADDTATFTIRSGLKFYPSGNPVTAQDAAWSLQRALKFNGVVELNNSGIFKPEQISAPDDSTLVIHYQDAAGKPVTASPINIATLRMGWYGVIDSKVAKSHATSDDPDAGKWLAANVAGTGPYYLAQRTVGQSLQLKAVPEPWNGKPAFSTVDINIVNNANVQSLLTGGTINVALFGLSPKDAKSLKDAGQHVVHVATPTLMYLQMAEDTGPLADKSVRQAIADAIPYDDVISVAEFGQAERAYSFVPATAAGYAEAWKQYGDPAKAASLMQGHAKISTTLKYPNDDAAFQSTAILIKDSLGKIGIDVTLQPQTSSSMFGMLMTRASGARGSNDGGGGMVLYSLSMFVADAKTPVPLWSTTKGVVNYARSSNPTIDELQAKFSLAAPGQDRDAAYQQIQQLAADDASFIPVVTVGRTIASAPSITGLNFQTENGLRYWMLKPDSK